VVGVREFEATAIIAAPRELVWQLLVDLDSWPAWNSGVIATEGRFAAGAKVRITADGKAGRGYPFRVTELVPPERLVLTGTTRVGLFTGVRTYLITPKAGGARIRVREEYRGLLAPAMDQALPNLTEPFQRFVDGLKELAESTARDRGRRRRSVRLDE
jgi:uncharacterized protein YndB with AHSA1/START domain